MWNQRVHGRTEGLLLYTNHLNRKCGNFRRVEHRYGSPGAAVGRRSNGMRVGSRTAALLRLSDNQGILVFPEHSLATLHNAASDQEVIVLNMDVEQVPSASWRRSFVYEHRMVDAHAKSCLRRIE